MCISSQVASSPNFPIAGNDIGNNFDLVWFDYKCWSETTDHTTQSG